MADDSNISGGRELDAFLQTLSAKVEKNIMRGAMRAGANVFKKEAREKLQANGSVISGLLLKGLKVSGKAKGGTVTASLKTTGKHNHLARWIEYGVAPHSIKKGAKRTSGIPEGSTPHPGFREKPFMRPTLDEKTPAAIAAVTAYVRKRLTKEGINLPDAGE